MMENILQAISAQIRSCGRGAASRYLLSALAAGTAVLATGAMALPPLYPAAPPPQGASANTPAPSDCNAAAAQLGAATSSAPITGAGTTGLYGHNATKGATVATTRTRPASAFGNGYVGAAGVPYAGGAYAGAPGFGRLGPGSMGTPATGQPSQPAQRMLALEPGHEPSSAPQSNCLAGHANAIR